MVADILTKPLVSEQHWKFVRGMGLRLHSSGSDKIPLTPEGTPALWSYLIDFLLTPELWTSTPDAPSLLFSTTLPLGNVLYTFVTILSVDPWSDTY